MSFGVGVALVATIALAVLAYSEPRGEMVKTYRPVMLPSPYSSAVGPSLAQLAHEQGADQPYRLPNPTLTPGAIRSTSAQEICALGYAKMHRVWHDKAGTLAKYGVPSSQAGLYEDDDLIPVCLGGDNADPRNHWPQPLDEARVKDPIEAKVCRAVCLHAGDSPDAINGMLSAFQALFQEDWRKLLPATAVK